MKRTRLFVPVCDILKHSLFAAEEIFEKEQCSPSFGRHNSNNARHPSAGVCNEARHPSFAGVCNKAQHPSVTPHSDTAAEHEFGRTDIQ